MSTSETTPRRRVTRFVRFAIFFFILLSLFVGGIAAFLYLLFSKYTSVQNIWLLVCGAPVVLIVLLLFTVVNLYTRVGKPLEGLFNAINEVEEERDIDTSIACLPYVLFCEFHLDR